MTLLAHGIDIVSVPRIAEMLDRHGDRFLSRCFTESERAYCDARSKRIQHYAGRFAAKEAVLKAIGTGLRDGMCWTDIEVVVDAMGAPGLRLAGAVGDAATARGIRTWSLSLSHTPEFAVASAIATG